MRYTIYEKSETLLERIERLRLSVTWAAMNGTMGEFLRWNSAYLSAMDELTP